MHPMHDTFMVIAILGLFVLFEFAFGYAFALRNSLKDADDSDADDSDADDSDTDEQEPQTFTITTVTTITNEYGDIIAEDENEFSFEA